MLTLSPSAIVYGDEQAEQFTVTVSGAGDTPTGTVTVSAGATTVCTIILADGTGACAPTADEFGVGTVTLGASYSGDINFGPSSSPTAGLQVENPPPATPVITTTTLGLSEASITYQDEQAERILVTVAVPGSSGDIPAGSVTVTAGTASVCEFSLSSSGAGSCGLNAASLPPGTARLTASYAGDPGFASSVSAAELLAIAKEPTTTTVSLSAGKVTYGAEQRERISVTVKPAHSGTPTGHVTVKAANVTICVITLRSARGTCALASTRTAAGRYKITAIYGGSGDVIPSVSAARYLSVAQASSTAVLSLSTTKVQYGSEGSARISVKIVAQHAGTPEGTATVRAGGATLAVIGLKSGQGSYTLSAKRLAAGAYTLVATYSGNANFRGSISAKRHLTVTSPPPPPPACYPLTSGGNCYEPGEYCPDRDHGLTGIAGDGEAIICEDNDGWRWEPLT